MRFIRKIPSYQRVEEFNPLSIRVDSLVRDTEINKEVLRHEGAKAYTRE